MKLLFDENLPANLPKLLLDMFPLSRTVLELGYGATDDDVIYQHAKDNGFIIVTKDTHFYRFCVAKGHPPKVIWVRTGNSSVRKLVAAFRAARRRIEMFELDDDPFLIIK